MKRFKNILCVIEPDDFSKAAVIQSVNLANSNQAKLTIVSVVSTERGFSVISNRGKLEEDLQEVIQNKQKKIELFISDYCNDIEVETKILVGINFIEIIREVLRENYDLIVKCCSNPTFLEQIFGSNDMHLFRKCPCAILMLKPDQVDPCANILATVDLIDDSFLENGDSRVQDQLNQKVMEYAVTFAFPNSTALHIGSAWDSYGEDFLRYGPFSHMSNEKADQYVEQTRCKFVEMLKHFIDRSMTKAGKDIIDYINIKTHLVKGMATIEIPLMANKHAVDLIVMGTVARTGIPGFLIGNTAESILDQVKCSVLAIKPEGFQTPITLID